MKPTYQPIYASQDYPILNKLMTNKKMNMTKTRKDKANPN